MVIETHWLDLADGGAPVAAYIVTVVALLRIHEHLWIIEMILGPPVAAVDVAKHACLGAVVDDRLCAY